MSESEEARMAKERWYSVGISGKSKPVSEGQVDALLEAAEAVRSAGWAGPTVSAGGGVEGVGIQVSVQAPDPPTAAARALEGFLSATEMAGIKVTEVSHVDVMTEEYLEHWLAPKPTEEYLGVAEVARMLGVSKQRVSEFRGQDLVPEPIAELESGPVWAASSWRGFLSVWPRRSGRSVAEYNRIVGEELERVPRLTRGSPQNELRMVYAAMRKHQLAAAPDRPALAVLTEALNFVRREHPDYPFQIDEEWFRTRDRAPVKA